MTHRKMVIGETMGMTCAEIKHVTSHAQSGGIPPLSY